MGDEAIDIVWRPNRQRLENSRLHDYMTWLAKEQGRSFEDYEDLWQWSVDHLEDFWASIWTYFDVLHSVPYERVLDRRVMPGASWFEGARLNLAEQVFRFHTGTAGERPAILSRSELRELQTLSWSELRRQVASCAKALRGMGV